MSSTDRQARTPRLDAICDEAIQRALDLDTVARDAAAEFVEQLAVLGVETEPYESYEAACRGEKARIITETLAAAGYDPADVDLMTRFKAMIESYLERADRYDEERRNRLMLAVWGSGPPGDSKLLDDPEARKVWERVYRLTCSGERIRPPASLHTHGARTHGARHRRAPARRPTRCRGSRRSASRDPDDGDPEPVAARSRRYWQETQGATTARQPRRPTARELRRADR